MPLVPDHATRDIIPEFCLMKLKEGKFFLGWGVMCNKYLLTVVMSARVLYVAMSDSDFR